MRKFEIYSEKAGVTTTLVFSENKKLIGIEFKDADAIIEPAFFYYFTQKMFNLEQVESECKKQGYVVTEIGRGVPDFNTVWETYGHKVDRKRAEDKWNKLKDANKIAAFNYIERYKNEVRRTGVAQMYLKTYLHNQVWK